MVGHHCSVEAQPGTPTPTATPIVFSPQTLTELKRLQQLALTSDYAYRRVAHLANNIGPRLSGSAQAEKAVEYVAAELKASGCEVQLEKVMVPHWVRGEETASLVEFPGQAENTTQKIVLCALGGSVATPADGIIAEVIAVRNFEDLNELGRDKVASRIVVFNYPFDKKMAAEDADLIADLARQGLVKMRLVLTPQQLPDAVSYNVIGDLKGSKHPEQLVIVSGHLDSWDLGTGAIDDAAGVAVSMQAVNLVQQLKLQPKRTIRVIAWMNEENGLAGSKTYAKNHEKEMSNHFAAIEIDGGAGHPVGVNMKARPEVKAMLSPVAAVLQESGAGILAFTENAGVDIKPLEEAGVPAFAPIQDSRFYFNYHHTAADTLDKIVPQELAENAAVIAVLTYAFANMEQPLPRAVTRDK
jgi:hypothetical protein